MANPVGEFPINDIWSYTIAVKRLLVEGEFHPLSWTSATLLTHVLWGSLFCKVFGFSFTTLRCCNLLTSLSLAVITACWRRRAPEGPGLPEPICRAIRKRWWARQGSNLQGLLQRILSPSRLPIPPRAQSSFITGLPQGPLPLENLQFPIGNCQLGMNTTALGLARPLACAACPRFGPKSGGTRHTPDAPRNADHPPALGAGRICVCLRRSNRYHQCHDHALLR